MRNVLETIFSIISLFLIGILTVIFSPIIIIMMIRDSIYWKNQEEESNKYKDCPYEIEGE